MPLIGKPKNVGKLTEERISARCGVVRESVILHIFIW